MKSLIASLAPLVGCAVKIPPGLLSLLSLMPVMGVQVFGFRNQSVQDL